MLEFIKNEILIMTKKYHYIFLCLLFCPILGCSYGTFKADVQMVRGTILLDGEPVSDADVVFHPQDEKGETAGGHTDKQGNFVLTSLYGNIGRGALQGEYHVTVSKLESIAVPLKGGEVEWDAKELLPPIYQDVKKTPLSAIIHKGKNNIKLELQKK
ncbi:MAG: carboxypeptidase-like regulatory domain-containing protein [Planctomycetaceae bacterium]|jgi:hypothetical protein|nr:carboxypeptidase-like regulatory domain-containing protein [Planctomycetaceae bacterium]